MSKDKGPKTNVIQLPTSHREQGGPPKEQEQISSSSLDRIQQLLSSYTDQIDSGELPVDILLDAIEHFMKQNEAEFMHYAGIIYKDLQLLKAELERRKAAARGETLVEKKNKAGQAPSDMGFEQGAEGPSSEFEQETGFEAEGGALQEQGERRDQPEEQPKKEPAFGKQLDKVNALMAKIEMAVGMQPRFNPRPNL